MKQNRKLAALLLCGVMSLSLLAGCGSSAVRAAATAATTAHLPVI